MKILQGWTVYHLSFVAFFVALALSAGINALLVKNGGGYAISSSAKLPYGDDQLWSWVVESEKRSKWQVGMYDASRLRGEPEEPESARMIFMRTDGVKYNGVEMTLEAVVPSKWVSRQELPTVRRIYTITLSPAGECSTWVTINETAEFYDFQERFWLFWNKSDHVERLEYSLRQLATWMGNKGEVCSE